MEVVCMELGLSKPWRPQSVTQRSSPNAVGPHSCYTIFSPQASAYDLMVSHNQMAEEKKTWAWFIGGCAQYAGTTWMWTAKHQNPLRHPWGQWWRRALQVGINSGSAPGSLLFLEGEMTRCVVMYQFMGCAQCFGWWSGTWKENNWKIGDKEIWGREWANNSLNEQKTWRYLCPMWILTKRWPEKRILIIKWIGWLILWISVSLFLQRETLSSPRGLLNKMAMVAGRRLGMGFYSSRLT